MKKVDVKEKIEDKEDEKEEAKSEGKSCKDEDQDEVQIGHGAAEVHQEPIQIDADCKQSAEAMEVKLKLKERKDKKQQETTQKIKKESKDKHGRKGGKAKKEKDKKKKKDKDKKEKKGLKKLKKKLKKKEAKKRKKSSKERQKAKKLHQKDGLGGGSCVEVGSSSASPSSPTSSQSSSSSSSAPSPQVLAKEFVSAAEAGDMLRVQYFVKKHGLSWAGPSGDGPLHLAARANNPGLVAWLLSKPEVDSVLDARNSRGETPLLLATRLCRGCVAMRLVEALADPAAADSKGEAPEALDLDGLLREAERDEAC
ncbi:unnamed protein product, partial [Polarella glacialis]